MRIRLDVSYDGTDFNGWAIQPSFRTVQGTLEDALAMALRVPSVRVVCAGRTDAGVHARGQVVHFDVAAEAANASIGRSRDSPLVALVRRVNGILPADIRVRRAVEAEPGFDARYSASWRRYAYRIADHRDLIDPLTRHHVLAWRHPLDAEAMNAAAAPLIGLHDFASFCRRREGATTVRTLLDLTWTRTPAGLLEARVVADAFCHTMVRSLVGCLLVIGEGRQAPPWAVEVMAGRSRHSGITVALPHGLTLEEVAYPAADELASQAERARNARSVIT